MPRPPELWLPKRKRWSRWAIGISLAAHALLFLVKIGAYLPPSRLPPATIYLVPPGAEGQRVLDFRFEEPGGAARKGKAAGITARPEEQAPAPEPEKLEPAPVEAPPVVPPVVETVDTTPRAAPPAPRRTVRIGPALGEGKLWIQPLPAPPREIARELTGRSQIELVDSAVSAIVQAYIDSVIAAPSSPGDRPPSWTTQVLGKTFGIDSKYIYLGGIKIPSAVLALLPLKGGGATMTFSQANRMATIREDLARASARAQTMEDFKRNIRELRAERERQKEIERNQKLKPEKPDTSKKP